MNPFEDTTYRISQSCLTSKKLLNNSKLEQNIVENSEKKEQINALWNIQGLGFAFSKIDILRINF